MSKPWGKHQYRRESPAPGGGVIEARFYTNSTSDPDPETIEDPSGMLTITRVSQSRYLVAFPDRWVYIYPDARFENTGGLAEVLSIKQGSSNDPNSFDVRIVDYAGSLVADTSGKAVSLRIGLYNQKGRAS